MMGSVIEIFKNRIKNEKEKRAGYNKYIFNSHLIMFALIILGAILFNYSKWLEVTTSVQLKIVIFIFFIILSYLLTTTRVKTFIKDADSIFLLPLEEKYITLKNKYLSSVFLVNILLAVLFVFLVRPIMKKLDYSDFYIILVIINFIVVITFTTLHKFIVAVYSEIVTKDLYIIFLNYFIITVGVVLNSYIIFLSVLGAIVYYFYISKQVGGSINWNGAANYDSIRQEKYLKFVSMFVDVPINTVTVNRRKYLDILLPKLTIKNFSKENSYKYYYLRVFLRQENTIFLVFRLLLISILFSYSFNNLYANCIILLSYNYLTIIQLIPLYKKINSNIWSYVLPVNNSIKLNSFKKLLSNIMIITTLVLTIIMSILSGFNAKGIIIECIFMVVSIIISKIFINKIR